MILFVSAQAQQITSPDGKFKLNVGLNAAGEPTFELFYNQKPVLLDGKLGIMLKDIPSFDKGFTLKQSEVSNHESTWETVWGENKTILNKYQELEFVLSQDDVQNRELTIRFRLFNDGLAFRYEFKEQGNLRYFIVTDELTSYKLSGNHKAFWIPGDYDSNEYAYTTCMLNEIDAFKAGKPENGIGVKSIFAENGIQTPLMLKSNDGLYISIHEAALVGYSAMHLKIDKQNFRLSVQLVPDAVGNKAYMQAPTHTPWRTFIISPEAEKILESNMILNLNEPNKFDDVSWIKPQKFVGIWWGMHVGTMSWNYANATNIKLDGFDWTKLTPNGVHGATTENAIKYIDFAAKHGFDGVLIEGWNVGWEDWFGAWKDEVFDFVTPYPDFDLKKVTDYANSKRVKIIMHHETSASVSNYERRMTDAYNLMAKYGYNTVKTGYVGRIIPRGEHHDGQFMVDHYVRVAEKLGSYKMMVDMHESVRPTGLHRTYPNWLANEAARGNEFNAWSVGNPPEHETILPFTRLIGGPMDYTPGIFQIKMNYYVPDKKEQVHTTLAKQLALYVTMYSPVQMVADLPENYDRFPDAFQFIKDVAVDWEFTKVLDAEPGDYIITARKDRNSKNWFVGAITDENPFKAQLKFNFLDENTTYVATVYADAADAHWQNNPMAYTITRGLVTAKSVYTLKLAAGGGTAISLKPATAEELKALKALK